MRMRWWRMRFNMPVTSDRVGDIVQAFESTYVGTLEAGLTQREV
jgi:hypothetical protein